MTTQAHPELSPISETASSLKSAVVGREKSDMNELPFARERYVPTERGAIALEHWHRYYTREISRRAMRFSTSRAAKDTAISPDQSRFTVPAHHCAGGMGLSRW